MPKKTMQLLPGSHVVSPKFEAYLDKPDVQADFAIIGNKLRERLDADFTVFSPEASADNPSVIDDWLEDYETRFLMLLPDVFFEQYPVLRSRYQDQGEIADLGHRLLQKVYADLRRYALRRLAIWWSASSYPNAVKIGEPEKEGDNYLVPVFSLRDNHLVGNMTLTSSGEVIEDQTITGRQLRELLSRAA